MELANGGEQRLDVPNRQLIGRWSERIGRRLFVKQHMADRFRAVSQGIEVVAALQSHYQAPIAHLPRELARRAQQRRVRAADRQPQRRERIGPEGVEPQRHQDELGREPPHRRLDDRVQGGGVHVVARARRQRQVERKALPGTRPPFSPVPGARSAASHEPAETTVSASMWPPPAAVSWRIAATCAGVWISSSVASSQGDGSHTSRRSQSRASFSRPTIARSRSARSGCPGPVSCRRNASEYATPVRRCALARCALRVRSGAIQRATHNAQRGTLTTYCLPLLARAAALAAWWAARAGPQPASAAAFRPACRLALE